MATSEEFRRVYRYGALVIWPPDDLRATVNALRQRYDPASQIICDAHITLTQPFVSEPDDDDLAAVGETVASQLPLRIEYGPLGTFLPYPCVYLQIRPEGPLKALQRALYDLDLFNLTLPFSNPAEYVFHMSITDGYPDELQTALIFNALRGSEPSGDFVVDRVAWIRPDDSFHFETFYEFPLDSTAGLTESATGHS